MKTYAGACVYVVGLGVLTAIGIVLTLYEAAKWWLGL